MDTFCRSRSVAVIQCNPATNPWTWHLRTLPRSQSSRCGSTFQRRADACQQQAQQQVHKTIDPSMSPSPLCLQRLPAATVATAAVMLAAAHPGAANAFTIHAEPANALSLPTWAIHVSSVSEWVAAMALFWKYAEVTGNQRWKGLTWGMMPALGSAMAACTWHFFYNSPGERA